MSKARGLADLGNVYNDGALSNRNLVINGEFAVSQRGDYSSATAAGSSSYYLDRWKIALSVATGSVQHNEVVLPNGTKTMAMKIVATAPSATGYVGTRQVIEDFRALSGQIVTASMWVRTTLNSLTFRHDSTANFGGFVNPDGQWHYHTATYQMPDITAVGGGANQTTLAILNYTGSTGGGTTSGDYLEVAQVQLEVGDTATPFEHRSYGQELALCQRYYEFFGDFDIVSQGTWLAVNNHYAAVQVPSSVPMRSSPTIQGTLENRYGGGGGDWKDMAAGGNITPRVSSSGKVHCVVAYTPTHAWTSSGWIRCSSTYAYDAEL